MRLSDEQTEKQLDVPASRFAPSTEAAVMYSAKAETCFRILPGIESMPTYAFPLL
jgi:hypothetical protein